MKRKAWTSRVLNLRILLVALAIQGITPSTHNLASSRLLRILFETAPGTDANPDRGEAKSTTGGVAENGASPGGSEPPINKHRKKTPGVVCLAVRTGWQAGMRRHAGKLLRVESVSEGPWEALIESARSCPPHTRRSVEQGIDLLHSLCRLTC